MHISAGRKNRPKPGDRSMVLLGVRALKLGIERALTFELTPCVDQKRSLQTPGRTDDEGAQLDFAWFGRVAEFRCCSAFDSYPRIALSVHTVLAFGRCHRGLSKQDGITLFAPGHLACSSCCSHSHNAVMPPSQHHSS